MENKIVMPQFRIGCGYDVHKLAEERKLIICGVEVPYEKGLLGHSDADVALHALMDALWALRPWAISASTSLIRMNALRERTACS